MLSPGVIISFLSHESDSVQYFAFKYCLCGAFHPENVLLTVPVYVQITAPQLHRYPVLHQAASDHCGSGRTGAGPAGHGLPGAPLPDAHAQPVRRADLYKLRVYPVREAGIPLKQGADLFEVAYLEHHDLESIKFIIAHEMSHIRLRHATFLYQLSILYANYIPILSSALSRAREYSCDRVAQHLVGVSGVEPMLALVVGKHLYKKVDVEDYVKHCHETRGFFVFILNLMSTHPIMPKRIQALLKESGSGRLFF